ncbi:MAG: hypothetical protein IRZ16_08375 [Myxococcaceae bacterium]|nr:hypothetical protein [Myxococcaceae bacterium]
MSDAACPRCGVPRVPAPECPRCGVIYARAEARARQLAALTAEQAGPAFDFSAPERPPHLPPETPAWDGDAEERATEARLRLIAPPVVLGLSFLLVSTKPGAFIARVTSGMWLHELGHAVCAWLCGYSAVPLPWFTSIGGTKSPMLTLLFVAFWSYLAYRAHRAGQPFRRGAFASIAALHLLLAAALGRSQAQAAITFFGDGGALLLGAALMSTFYVAPGSRLHQGALRWGLLGIGALGFADVLMPWLRAVGDRDEIPFGRIEGIGLSDPSKLVDVHGITVGGMVRTYLAVGALALLATAAIYVVHAVRFAWQLRQPGAQR